MKKLRVSELAMGLLVTLAVTSGAAWAQSDTADDKSGEDRPWAVGVSEADQKEALVLFREGNSLLKDSLFAKAAEKYREAVAHWDHPAIHYNLALALLNLDKPLEVYATLEKTLRFGAAPIGEDKFEHARSYKTLIEKQLAHVTITCEVRGAKVMLDGKTLFEAPGKYQGLVRIGEHNIVASKAGMLTTSESRTFGPGERATIDVKLFTDADVTRYRRKWATWKPWMVVAGGAAVTVLGGTFHLLARNNFRDYDAGILACGGCHPDETGLADKKSSAEWQQNAAIVSYAIGGVALAAGITLVYINRSTSYRIDVKDLVKQDTSPPVAVVPLLGPGTVGFSTSIRF